MSLPDHRDITPGPSPALSSRPNTDRGAAQRSSPRPKRPLSTAPQRPHVSLTGTWILIQNLPDTFDSVPGHGPDDIYAAVRALSFEARDTISGGVAIDVRVSPQAVLDLIDAYHLISTPRALRALHGAAKEYWQEQSLCKEADPEQFFPEKGGATALAKKLCKGCPVKAQCLEFALTNDERFGIWGGLSERERRKLNRRRPRRITAEREDADQTAPVVVQDSDDDYRGAPARRVG